MNKILLKLKLPWLMIVVAVISRVQPAGAQSVWNAANGVSANTNWSTPANWSPSGVPGATSNVLFVDTATAAPGTIDNVVDVNTTIQRLAYRQTNGVHNTLILPGVTLTISNSLITTNLLLAGTDNSASPTTLIVTNTISGAGASLIVTSANNGSSINVRQITTGAAGSHLSVLDMSGLDKFNATVGNFYVGVFGGSGTTRPQGVLFLARTNSITLLTSGTKAAPSLDIGDTGSSPDVGNNLALGITNSITADSIVVGNQRSGGILNFNAAFTNITTPSFLLRGNTNSRVTTFNIGDNSSATASIGSSCSGVVDFSGGMVDVMVASMTLGDGQPVAGSGATGTATGTLTMTAGKLDVNTLEVGFQNNTGVPAANTGTVNINGGTLTVNTSMRLAFYAGSGGLSKGTLNITNGTVKAVNIAAGGGTSTVNVSGGTLIVSNTMGSVASALSALSVNSGATLQLSASSGVTPATVTNLSSDSSGVINIGSLPAIPSYPSQFPLIAYQSGGSGVTFAMGTLPNSFTGYISNDNANTIWLVISNGPSLGSVTWGGGVNNLWDTNSLNWTNNGVVVKYRDPDIVTFDDSGRTGNITLTNTFMPGAWFQTNNTLGYTFSGIGSVSGSGGLVMNGSGTVTLGESGGDNFSGGIRVNAGKVILDDANCAISGGLTIVSGATAQIGNNDANGNLPGGALDDEGTLIFQRTDTVLLNLSIPGAGALTQNGTGTLVFTVANSYTGNTTINAGTLALTNTGSIASAQVNVTGAKLDVSGVPGVTTLSNVSLANANINLSVGYLQTNLHVNALSLGGTGNTLNVASLPVIASYPLTLTVIQSANPITGFNMTVGTLPVGSSGSVSLSGDGTAVLLTLTSGPIGVRPSVVWSGADAGVTTNWSDRLNWQEPGAPVPADNVIFNNTAATLNSDLSSAGGGAAALLPNYINNFADTNFTIASLTYTNNSGSYHNTAITNGATLNITNFFTVGGLDTASALQTEFVNISGTGGATLAMNNTNGSFQVWLGDSGTAASYATLDLSALDNFTANVNRITVGACAANNAVNRPSGNLYLARTNNLTCVFQTTTSEAGSTTGNSGIVLGDCNQNQGPTSYLYLGQVNTISADTIGIARQKSSGNVLFNPIYANVAPYPSVIFKGFSSSLVSDLDVGDGVGNTGTTSGTGDLNLTGGFVTANADTINIGRASGGASGSGITAGGLEFDAGVITANTVNIGFQPVTGSKGGYGVVTVGTNSTLGAGATLVVNGTLNLGVNVGGTGASGTSGTLTINGGTVQAGIIAAGTNSAQSAISLNAGTLIVTGTAGTPAAPLNTLGLADATTLQLDVNGAANVTNIVATSVNMGGTTILQIGSLTGVITGIDYPLISYTGGDPFGGFGPVVLPAGYSGSLVDNSGSGIVGLTLTVVPPPPKPAHITGISVSGTTLNLSATNGVSSGRYVLIGTTNLAKPLNQWTPILTNNFNGSGNLNLSTNIINPATAQQFYIISQ